MAKDNSKDTELTKSVTIKITEQQRKQLGALAKGSTLKDTILESTLYNESDQQIKELEGTLLDYKKEIKLLNERLEQKQQIKDQLELKDIELSNLSEQVISLTAQLEQANTRLDDFTVLLNQQQKLNLSTLKTNEQLKDQLTLLEDSTADKSSSAGSSTEKDTRGLFSRIFNL